MVYSGYLKQKKKLYIQTVQIKLSVLSNIIIEVITGAIIILSIALLLGFNKLGFIGLLQPDQVYH